MRLYPSCCGYRLMKEKEESEESSYKVRVSISEIYNEQIRDLLHGDKVRSQIKSMMVISLNHCQ